MDRQDKLDCLVLYPVHPVHPCKTGIEGKTRIQQGPEPRSAAEDRRWKVALIIGRKSAQYEPFAKFARKRGFIVGKSCCPWERGRPRPHKTWQGRGDWLHRVGRFTRRLTLEQRLDKYAGGTPALPGGNPWLARCRSLSRALFCRSILPPSHARLRILQKAQYEIFSLFKVQDSFFWG